MSGSSSPCRSSTSLTDLDVDSITHIASYLNIRDVSNMAMSCKQLNRAAYSDSIWQSLYRREWEHVSPSCSGQTSSMRKAFMSRRTDVNQFKFQDPMFRILTITGKPPHQILFDKDSVVFSKGPLMQSLSTDNVNNESVIQILGSHNARITCMRRFSQSETDSYEGSSSRDDHDILATSSSDHSIRIWSKGGNRCFKGHSGPVSTLSDKLIGDRVSKVFASGSEDCTVRVWSISSEGKRGQRALRATLHGHDKAVSLVSVAGHKTSLLVSISKNGKVRVWDTTAASSSGRSSCCVGTTSVASAPVGMKCHESLLYVAAESSVTAVDLRTMRRAFSVVQQTMIHSFDALLSRSTFCIGQNERAMLYDIRKVSDKLRAEPSMELRGHTGPMKHLHMDSYKVVSAGANDPFVKVWDACNGTQTNSLLCSGPYAIPPDCGCLALAVDGCRIAVAGFYAEEATSMFLADYNSAKRPFLLNDSEANSKGSKFWGSMSDSSDSEGLDWDY